MTTAIDRREFVRRALLAVGGASLGTAALRATLARAATVSGVGPYGALSATADANGFFLPAGFSSRLLAVSGTTVAGTSHTWHEYPDGGACFPVQGGGWVYTSNAEVSSGGGGVSALKFDSSGAIIGAYSILSGTSRNCAGGPTVAGKWLSCEESGSAGQVYECDPYQASQGVRRAAMGAFNHEAAFEDPVTRAVFLTEDATSGRFYKFVPTTAGDFSAGQLYAASVSAGVITWVPTSASAPDRAANTTAFNGGEGLWIDGRDMYFTTKGDQRVWWVNPDTNAISVFYDGVASPSALNAVDNCVVHAPSGDVFVCEDGGNMEVGIISELADGNFEVAPFLRLSGQSSSELAGAAFSPDHSRMYVSSQRGTNGVTGRTYEITGPFRVPATSTTIRLTDDAHVRDGKSAGANFGTATSTQVQTSSAGNNRVLYMKVDTSAHVGGLTRAVLRVTLKGTKGSSTPVALHAVASTAWTESTINWNNRPSLGNSLATSTVVGSSNTWHEFDITSFVVAEREAGRRTVSLAIKAPNSSVLLSGVSAESSSTTLRPVMVITR